MSANTINVKSTEIDFRNASNTSKTLSITSDGALQTQATFEAAGGIVASSLVVQGQDSIVVTIPTFEQISLEDGSGKTTLKTSTSASDITLTLPAADGTSGQVLTTDGSGQLSFATASGGASFTDNKIEYNTSSGASVYESTGASWNSTNSANSSALPSAGLYYVSVSLEAGTGTSALYSARWAGVVAYSSTSGSSAKYLALVGNGSHGVEMQLSIGATGVMNSFTYPRFNSTRSRTTFFYAQKLL